MILSKPQLLDRVLAAIDASGWQALMMNRKHPFLLRVFRRGDPSMTNLRVYIWNCTHGGNNRAADEYRVQITGVVPNTNAGEVTLLLGWHDGYGVFVGFDIRKHAGQASESPSIQVKERNLLNAHNHAFSAYDRANGEIAVCFRPEFLVDYAQNLAKLHGFKATNAAEVNILNSVDTTSEEVIDATVKNLERKDVLATIKRKYREHDFRERVLSAYSRKCAACGVQLKLVEAAHIIPVASPTSTDETINGVGLCALHHKAFDQNLFSFDDSYRVEVSTSAVVALKGLGLVGGLQDFQDGLKDAILLPADKRDYPSPNYIREARKVREWKA